MAGAETQEVTFSSAAELAKAYEEAPIELGSLVRIEGVEELLRPFVGDQWVEVDDTEEPVDVNNMDGVLMDFDEEENKYVVHTFDGGWFALPPSQLQLFQPSAAESGGFDTLWPVDDSTGARFHYDVMMCLQTKGYAVIQMFTTPSSRKNASEESKRPLFQFKKFTQQEEPTKLGKDNTTRVIELQTPDDEEERFEESEQPALDAFNREISYASLSLSEVWRHTNATEIWGRTDTWLRMPYGSTPDQLPHMTDPEEYKQHLMWMTNRKICMIYVIESEGGEMSLFPRGEDGNAVEDDSIISRIPLRRGQMIVFHNDKLDYSYQPQGESLAMQSWLMTEPQDLKICELDKPPNRDKPMLHVMSVMERFPAGCFGADKSWLMFFAGTDAEMAAPIERMEHEMYYEFDPDAILKGKAYINHGSFLLHEHCFGFDHEFWDMSYEEGACLGINQRWLLETGYTAFHKAGYHKKELMGARIGLSIGDYIQEWDKYNPTHKYQVVDDRQAYTAHILQFHLGFTGPTIHADTACSASMVALNGMCHLMRGGEFGSQVQVRSALCCGILSMLDFFPWVGECAGTMLSYTGRCFTFNQSADGFIRGEGCCATNIQLGEAHEEDAMDQKGRLAVLRGTNSNQDGRSASLTAPSGPSQQACIRMSLREAGLDPTEVWVGECHGTGTALGDPIEVGANKAVFAVKGRHELNHCLVSAKSHIGHTESNAGVCGFIKVVLMLIHGCSTPDPHINQLNSHLDTNSYPIMFSNEPMDSCHSYTHGGVSSFGFGGANTRGDMWARVQKGSRKTGKETVLEAGEALSFAKYALTDGKLPTLKEPKLKAVW